VERLRWAQKAHCFVGWDGGSGLANLIATI